MNSIDKTYIYLSHINTSNIKQYAFNHHGQPIIIPINNTIDTTYLSSFDSYYNFIIKYTNESCGRRHVVSRINNLFTSTGGESLFINNNTDVIDNNNIDQSATNITDQSASSNIDQSNTNPINQSSNSNINNILREYYSKLFYNKSFEEKIRSYINLLEYLEIEYNIDTLEINTNKYNRDKIEIEGIELRDNIASSFYQYKNSTSREYNIYNYYNIDLDNTFLKANTFIGNTHSAIYTGLKVLANFFLKNNKKREYLRIIKEIIKIAEVTENKEAVEVYSKIYRSLKRELL